jgi:hypothetical protein
MGSIMKNETRGIEELENQFEPIDDIICYECTQTKIGACVWLDGECSLNLL